MRAVQRHPLVLLLSIAFLASCLSDEGEEAEPERCFQTRLANCGGGPWDPFGIVLAVAGQCPPCFFM